MNGEIEEIFESVITHSTISSHIDVFDKKTCKAIGYLFGCEGNYEIYLGKCVNDRMRYSDIGHTDSFYKGVICLAILNPWNEEGN